MNIYIVLGSTGEYSDRSEWIVGAFETMEAAETKVADLEMAYRGLLQGRDPFDVHYEARKAVTEAMEELDPQFSLDYTGTTWRIEGTEYFQ